MHMRVGLEARAANLLLGEASALPRKTIQYHRAQFQSVGVAATRFNAGTCGRRKREEHKSLIVQERAVVERLSIIIHQGAVQPIRATVPVPQIFEPVSDGRLPRPCPTCPARTAIHVDLRSLDATAPGCRE